MILRLSLLSFVLLHGGILLAGDYKLATVDAAPEGLADDIAAKLDGQAYRLSGPDGALFDLWLLEELETKDGFAPTFMVKYPFAPGQLIGALVVPDGADFKDFRGQDIAPGAYTLRYGLQPEDGNHIGTSEVSDFLLALPAGGDKSVNAIGDSDALSEKSAKSVGTTHPAIFSLLPAEEPVEGGTLSHDEDHDYWILNIVGNRGDESKHVPMRVIAIGEAEV